VLHAVAAPVRVILNYIDSALVAAVERWRRGRR
jgi:hypothetical protein